ncbi:hypothetical protein Slin14017_G035960 [Septoria linicola]|nr:hypothetical protein Slin14017_G035960 [Septoria linicola]
MRTQKLLRAAGTLVVLHSSIKTVSAQNCYYPNGDVARTDASCSSDGGACCPLGWDCLSNGLCFLGGNEQYFGRYTCTDRDWGGDCPQYCTSNNTAAGNEAIVQCSDGSWCCDKNRDPQKPDCCSWDDKEVVDVPDGTTVTSITSTPKAPSSVPPLTRTPSSATTTNDSTTTSSSRSSITTEAPTTITTRATSSDSTGGIVIITSIVTTSSPSATVVDANSDSEYPGSHGAPNNGVVIGVSIGVSTAVLVFFIVLFLLWRRRRQKWAAQRSPPTSDYPNNHMSFMYNHGKGAHEIDSYPVAVPGGGRDKSRPISELTGSNHFMPGSPVSSMNTAISPPGYSPSVNGSMSAGTTGGWNNSPTFLPGVQEQPEPQELPPEGNPPRESQRAPMPPVSQVQPKKTEMTQSGGAGLFTYEPYRPYRPEELVKKADNPFEGQSSKKSEDEALRTMSPDPPQPIQGGLRVVNQ